MASPAPAYQNGTTSLREVAGEGDDDAAVILRCSRPRPLVLNFCSFRE